MIFIIHSSFYTCTESFILFDNEFTGTIPTEIGNMALRELRMHRNELVGPIPDELYRNVNLRVLRLDENKLTGSLSNRLGLLENLLELRVGNNTLTGNIPFMLYGLNELRKLNEREIFFLILAILIVMIVINEQLTCLTDILFTNTELIDLSNNTFTGSVRNAFSRFQDLDFIDLGNNRLTGEIPPSLFDIPSIRLIYLQNNNLEGFLPDNYGNPPKLRDLYLNNNLLFGQIPDIQSGQLSNLTEFLLQDNDLTGEMPASVCALRTPIGMLEDLWADCEEIEGEAQVECSCCTQCQFSSAP